MRPTLINEVAGPVLGPIMHVEGVGWLAVDGQRRAVRVLDLDLREVILIEVPVQGRRFRASVSARHLAAVSLDELVVCAWRGRTLWRSELAIEGGGLPCEPGCHLDTHGVLVGVPAHRPQW